MKPDRAEMTIDEAREQFEAQPSMESAAALLTVGTEYWNDDMLSDVSFEHSVLRPLIGYLGKVSAKSETVGVWTEVPDNKVAHIWKDRDGNEVGLTLRNLQHVVEGATVCPISGDDMEYVRTEICER